MKRLLFTLFFCFPLIGNSAQISFVLDNPSLKELISEIESQSDFKFAYGNEIEIETKLSGKYTFQDEDLEKILTSLSKETPFSFDVLGNNIAITEDLPVKRNKVKKSKPQMNIEGNVTDSNGMPLPSVTVQEKGTNNGVMTDFDGNYSIEVSSAESVLIFTYIGMTTTERTVGETTTLDIQMEEDSQALDEVVVVGYGSISKKDITGSVGSLEMDEVSSRPVVDFGQALSGKMPGVQVISGSGRPGSSSSIQIRGVNSISAGGAPLIVVDGVQLPGFDLNSINSSDIKSIEVLKDAASAAIYGSRGANGVVLVTTKSGKTGKPRLTFDYTSSLQEVIRKIDVMDASEYSQAAIDAAQNGWIDQGGDPGAPNTIEARGNYKYTWPTALENPETLPNTDFQDVIFRVAPMHQFNMSYSGGNEQSNYYVSAGYLDQKGIVITSEYQRYSLNMNAESQINDWLKIGGMLRSLYDNEEEPYNRTIEWAVQYPSIFPVYGNNGYLGGPLTVDGFGDYNAILFRPNNGHPLYRINDDIQHESFTGMGNFFLNIELLDGLDFRTSFNPLYETGKNSDYVSGDHNLGTSYITTPSFTVDNFRTLSYTWSNTLTFDKKINDHSLNILAGYEFNHRDYYMSIAGRRGYDSDELHSLHAGRDIVIADDDANQTNLISYLGRVNYSLLNRYILSASIRRDGSSRFGPENKWGDFWSVSGAWRVTDEDFLRSSSIMSNLKLKASYGVTGNDNFEDYIWMSRMNLARAALGENLLTTYYPANIENEDLEWEGTRQWNLGIDIGLWNNRINLDANVYHSVSDNLLLNVPLPALSGYTSVFSNNGELMNRGLEVALQTQNISRERLNWSTQFNLSFNRSEITELGRDNASMLFNLGSFGSMQKINKIGAPAFSFYGYQYDGVYMDQAEIDEDPASPSSATPGVGRYRDLNGDGRITAEDRTIIGNTQPDFSWGLTNTFTIGNFDVSVLLQGVVGGEIYDDNAHRSLLYHEGRNYLEAVNNRWRSEENPGDGYQYKLTVDPSGMDLTPSSYWLSSGSYFRLKDVTVGYDFPERYASSLGLSNARIFFNGVNLLTVSEANVFDPENFLNSNVSSPLYRGVGGSAYPTAKTYSLGLKIKF
ncbi:SusC/RagA family TonB-linked outer membrane protein [uncultured Salegentibacter sp.]|uniref:SusC/RagA family TonB-linked outer membrane protein n=1 Tax=uncultured Salegentibacter sp. TaxID=259320 RepID=UPI0030DB2025